jgi:hypothetical protein
MSEGLPPARPGPGEAAGIVPGSSTTPLAYFAAIQHQFERAVAAAGSHLEFDYEIAGCPLRLRFAGDALVPTITSALAHLRTVAHAAPRLTIGIWESASMRVPIPRPPWCRPGPTVLGSLDYFHDQRLHLAYRHQMHLTLLDPQRGLGFFWCPEVPSSSASGYSTPLRMLFHWWMTERGYALCHAAGVGSAAGAVLVGGKSGSGKSTTALACLAAGMSYVGDDMILVQRPPQPTIHSLYNSVRLNANDLPRFSQLTNWGDQPDDRAGTKAIFMLQQRTPRLLALSLPLRAVVFPRITGAVPSRLQSLSASASLALLAPSSIEQRGQVCGLAQATLDTLTAVVRHVPSYRLELGTDLAQVPPLLQGLLSRT